MSDWFLEPDDKELKFVEITDGNPLGYTLRYCYIDDDHAFSQEQFSQDYYYFAWCPELEGCYVWGYDEPFTVAKLRKIIPIVIENMTYKGEVIPPPGSHKDIA